MNKRFILKYLRSDFVFTMNSINILGGRNNVYNKMDMDYELKFQYEEDFKQNVQYTYLIVKI